MFSEILTKQNLRKNIILKRKKLKEKTEIIYQSSFFSAFFKDKIYKVISLIFNSFIKKQSLVMFDTNLSLKNRIYLSIRNFSIPTRIDIKKLLIVLT